MKVADKLQSYMELSIQFVKTQEPSYNVLYQKIIKSRILETDKIALSSSYIKMNNILQRSTNN